MSLDWLVARPIAHRGRHDQARGVIENSLPAADIAIATSCAIECDVQMTADGEAVVFHDETLERLTDATGLTEEMSASQISRLNLEGASITAFVPTLASFLNHIGERVPVIIEIKSRFNGDMRLAERTARIACSHSGQIALKSFDPAIIAHLRRSQMAGDVPLGLVTQGRFDDAEWDFLDEQTRQSMTALLHWRNTQPDFLSFCVRDLPHASVALARAALALPVMTWTVRTPAQWDTARQHADQAIFEGPLP